MLIKQVVQLELPGAARPYTYAYYFTPGAEVDGRALRLGDVVEIPGNVVNEDGGSGVVCCLGSNYRGKMATIVRRLSVD